MKAKRIEPCTCEVPVVTQAIPPGFKGTVECRKCAGIIKYPLPEETYKGKDPIAGYLFNIKKRNVSITADIALVMLLDRIDKKLGLLIPKKGKTKKKDK